VDKDLNPMVISAALARHPDAAVLVLPRYDGQYSVHASDILGLLREIGLPAAYASDPMAAGEHAEKGADVVLPLLFAVGAVSDWATTVDGLVFVVKYFLTRVGPTGTVRLRAGYHRTAEGDEYEYVELDLPGDRDPAEAVRAALGGLSVSPRRDARRRPRP
jgi:hypothetical protein